MIRVGSSSRAARLVAPHQWKLVEVEKPSASPGKMLVRLERVAICGSDKPPFCGIHDCYPLPPGSTGHEGLGIVESCPSGTYEAGERVLLSGFDRGLFQEYVLADDHGLLRLPKEHEPEIALMSQLLGTVLHSFRKLGNVIHQQAVVIGQGPAGQLFDAVLRNLGARHIIAVDTQAYRLEVARRMGATHAVHSLDRDVVDEVARITRGEMADLVVEAVGTEESLDLCGRLARRNGTVICFGVPDKDNHEGVLAVRFMEVFRKELRLVSSVGPEPLQDYAAALDWIVQGRIDVRPIVTHVEPFARIQQAFEMSFEKSAEYRALKVVLAF